MRRTGREHVWLSRFKKDEGNCFLYGCATLAVVLILGGILATVSVRYGFNQLREKWTDDKPIDLPAVELPEDEMDALVKRVEDYADALMDDEALEPLTLTQLELNALAQNHPELKDYVGDIYFTIEEDDVLIGQLSMPLDGFPGLTGRYFNCSATLHVAVEDGEFVIEIEEATVNGEPVPESFMNDFRGKNIVEEVKDDPKARDLIEKVQSVEIKGGVIVLTPANLLDESAEPEESEAEEVAP